MTLLTCCWSFAAIDSITLPLGFIEKILQRMHNAFQTNFSSNEHYDLKLYQKIHTNLLTKCCDAMTFIVIHFGVLVPISLNKL